MEEIDYRLSKLESELEKIVREIVELRKEISKYKGSAKEMLSDDEGNVIWW